VFLTPTLCRFLSYKAQKSGKRTRAKSLASYVEKCTPSKTFKLTGTQGSSALEQTNIVMLCISRNIYLIDGKSALLSP
jgi:hypothetical protein|tara:strand:+ start:23255 stop:23488 length:234 start_codon:yes stop_codon:yes gene_type:complete